jgi:hypothetical protein
MRLPAASKSISRESAWGELPEAVPPPAGVRVGHVGELAARGLRGVDPEEAAGEVEGADRVGELRREGQPVLQREGLAVAADVDDVGVGGIGDDRQVDRRLAAGVQAGGVDVGAGLGPVEGGPGGAAVAGAEEAGQAAGVGDRRVDVVVLADGELDVRRHAADQQRVHRRARDLGPGGAGVAAAVDAVDAADEVGEDDAGEEPLLVVGVAHQVEGHAAGQAGGRAVADPDLGEGGAAVNRAPDADVAEGEEVGDVDRDHQRRAAGGDAGDVLADEDAAAVDRLPARAAVGGAQQARAQAAEAAEARPQADAGHQRLVPRVGGVELERADGQRRLEVGELLPLDLARRGVGRLPDAAVDGADVERLGRRRMGGDDVDGAHRLVAGDDVLDLGRRDRRRALGLPFAADGLDGDRRRGLAGRGGSVEQGSRVARRAAGVEAAGDEEEAQHEDGQRGTVAARSVSRRGAVC